MSTITPELNYVLEHVPLKRLQELAKKLCEESPEARAIAEAELLAPASTSASSTGRKRPRYVHCINCKAEYDTTENDEESCQWHPGDLDVNWDGDTWADHDERVHGTIDTDSMRLEYPEGFMWDCCNEEGDAEGCETNKHQIDIHYQPGQKKRKMWDH